jgi:hypothetical protein
VTWPPLISMPSSARGLRLSLWGEARLDSQPAHGHGLAKSGLSYFISNYDAL